MALYPTPAGHRMAWDRDGSAPFVQPNGGTVAQLSTAQAQVINNENQDGTNVANPNTAGTSYCGVVFPELRDLSGYFLVQTSDGSSSFTLQTSVDTTNGIDGTWVSQGAPTNNGTVNPNYRSAIVALTVSGIKAIRLVNFNPVNINLGWNLYAWHLYGQPSANQNPDSLRIWQPVTNAEIATVEDFGDTARGSSTTVSFRVHNQSATKTASTITVSLEALTDASPSLIGQFQLSTDNVTYANSISIANLGPGATSPVLYVRDNVAPGAAVSVWAARMVASAGTFA